MSALGQPAPMQEVAASPRYAEPDWKQEGLRLNILTTSGETAAVLAYQSPDRLALICIAPPDSDEGRVGAMIWESLTAMAAGGTPASDALAAIQAGWICAIDSSRDLTTIVSDLSVS